LIFARFLNFGDEYGFILIIQKGKYYFVIGKINCLDQLRGFRQSNFSLIQTGTIKYTAGMTWCRTGQIERCSGVKTVQLTICYTKAVKYDK